MAEQDFTDKYNTKLTDDQEKQFQDWATTNNRTKDTYDYDLRGWWKANQGADASKGSGHLTDEYKKPNHPTFSDQSKYHGKDGFKGGSWGGTDEAPTFTPGPTNLSTYGKEGLQKYFQDTEPGVELKLPQSTMEKRYGAGQ